MRKLFWALLLANVILFAAMQRGWLGLGEQPSPEQPALHEELIRLLPTPQSAPVAALPASAPPAPPVIATAAPQPGPVDVSAQAASRPSAPACMEWGEFSGSDLVRAIAVLSPLQFGDKLSQYQVEHDIGYWVYIPPLKNRVAANRKVAELKKLGIKEYFVVQEGHWQNAISLGVFKTQDAAQNFLNELRTKGVHTAKAGQRASKFKGTIFRLNEVGILTEVKLTAMQKDFPGSELKHVPCAH